MLVQSPLRALVDPRRQLPLPTEGNHTRRRSDRYPCTATARLRIGQSIHEVRFMDLGYGGGRMLGPADLRPRPGVEGQVVARTKSGLCCDNVVVVNCEPRADGTVIRFRLPAAPGLEFPQPGGSTDPIPRPGSQ